MSDNRGGFAVVEVKETDYPYEGMAERVHVVRRGQQFNSGLSFIWPVCEICGAVLADQKRHDDFHDALDNAMMTGDDQGSPHEQ